MKVVYAVGEVIVRVVKLLLVHQKVVSVAITHHIVIDHIVVIPDSHIIPTSSLLILLVKVPPSNFLLLKLKIGKLPLVPCEVICLHFEVVCELIFIVCKLIDSRIELLLGSWVVNKVEFFLLVSLLIIKGSE